MKNWKNTTDFLREIPLPEQTRTYKPVSHAIFIDEIKEELYKRGHSVKTERYPTFSAVAFLPSREYRSVHVKAEP